MTPKKVVKIFLLVLLVLIVVLPFYLFRNYLVLGYKFYKPDYSKVKSTDNIVSVLVLGKGGEGHEAPDLTDTIINVYVNKDTKQISLLSLPRDIWLPELRAKLNSSYYWGKQRSGNGLSLASESVSGIVGIKPEYIAVVDFSIFKDLIDTLDGIEVDVQNSFTDNKFPIPGKEGDLCGGDKTYACRYETVTFTQGKQLMDGETALKFVRSRNAEGDEGTDIAREARQQKVISAIKNKILSNETLLNPNKLLKLYQVGMSHLETNIDTDTAIVLARLLYDGQNNITSLSIPEGFLKVSQNNPKQDYQYVFVPASGTWKELQEWINQRI